MSRFDGKTAAELIQALVDRARHVGTNVTLYLGPELARAAETTGQRNIFGGFNWDTRVRNRSAKYSVIVGGDAVAIQNPSPEQAETLRQMQLNMTRIFGGTHDGKDHPGHANSLPFDLIHRVMGSGEDPDFTFNCYLLVSVKNRRNHHIPYMWGKMLRAEDPVPGAESFQLLMVPDINTGPFGRFYVFPEQNCTVGIGSDYMGEAKKGFLRMAMFRAKQRGILGIHAGTKVVRARSRRAKGLRTIGVVILGLSGTGKTTNIGHTHYLYGEGEESLIAQDDFAGLRLKDGRILGTEQAMFLKTDLDEDDILLRPATESSDFVSQNLYLDYQGQIHYLEEDLCANGRGILPLRALPKERLYESIDLPPLDELDQVCFIFNTRRNTVVPIMSELTPEQAAAYFMLGESIETAAGDPTRIGQSLRQPGTNPFMIGHAAEEGNMFYEYVNRYRDKIRCFLMNTGGVGEIPNPEDPAKPKRPPNRPWKPGIGYITCAVFRESAVWTRDPDFGTRVLVDGVIDEKGDIFDMDALDPKRLYDDETRVEMVKKLNQERVEYLQKYDKLDPKIVDAITSTHLL
ncbi:MAG TPA: phosphoenolpyruvate carboxykinase (ATP) [Phycisphaerae bacterium]|nr:phosphoenolpyruvate carboxykinase (ATP) [Phycisphaerae bacterium]